MDSFTNQKKKNHNTTMVFWICTMAFFKIPQKKVLWQYYGVVFLYHMLIVPSYLCVMPHSASMNTMVLPLYLSKCTFFLTDVNTCYFRPISCTMIPPQYFSVSILSLYTCLLWFILCVNIIQANNIYSCCRWRMPYLIWTKSKYGSEMIREYTISFWIS